MTRKEFSKMIRIDVARRMTITKKKGADYAGDDILANFRRVGLAVDIFRLGRLSGRYAYAFFLIFLKIDRIINLMLKGTKPDNESLDDTFMDLKNYVDLLHALYKDNG